MYPRDTALRPCEECPWWLHYIHISIPLTTSESLLSIDPRLLVLEPQKNRTRLKGAKTKPTSQEEASTLRPDSKTHCKKAVAGGVGEAETAPALNKRLARGSFQTVTGAPEPVERVGGGG
jgi:hypothetical protein